MPGPASRPDTTAALERGSGSGSGGGRQPSGSRGASRGRDRTPGQPGQDAADRRTRLDEVLVAVARAARRELDHRLGHAVAGAAHDGRPTRSSSTRSARRTSSRSPRPARRSRGASRPRSRTHHLLRAARGTGHPLHDAAAHLRHRQPVRSSCRAPECRSTPTRRTPAHRCGSSCSSASDRPCCWSGCSSRSPGGRVAAPGVCSARSAARGRRCTARSRGRAPRSPTSPASTTSRARSPRSSTSCAIRRSTGGSARRSRGASCCPVRRAAARPCSPGRSPARRRCRSSRSPPRSSSRRSSASGPAGCATCSIRPRRWLRRSIFIDELDSIGRARGGAQSLGGNDEREQTLNQILTEMDGFTGTEGIVVLAATNRPEILDPALLRPGRFDRRVTVSPPDLAGRRQILAVHTRDVPLAPDVDLDRHRRGHPRDGRRRPGEPGQRGGPARRPPRPRHG